LTPDSQGFSFAFCCFLLPTLTPYLAITLAKNYGLYAVGYYLSAAAVIRFAALLAANSSMKER
jgi:hypothetical protein